MPHLTPAQYIIQVLGGPRATGRFVHRDHSSVIMWAKRPGGFVPPEVQKFLLEAAPKHGLDITAEDLILGRTVRASAIRASAIRAGRPTGIAR